MLVPMIAYPPDDAGMGSFWYTPGDQRDLEDNVNESVQSLDTDITASSASPSFKAAWATFKADWDDYYSSQGGVTGWLGRFMTAQSVDKTGDYRTQVEQWRTKFTTQEGGASSAPSLPPPPASTDWAKVAKYAAIAAGVLVAGYVGLKAWKKFGG